MNKATCYLHEAIEEMDLSSVKASIRDGADVNCCRNRQTACTKAIDSNCGHDIISAIVESHSFNVNAANQFDRTPLHFAAKNGDCRLTKLLLMLGPNVDQPDILGITPLGAAAWYDHVEVGACLLKHGACLNSKSHSGETPLYRACVSDSYEMAEFLITRGCDVNTHTNDNHNHPGHTPIMACLIGANYHDFASFPKKRISRAMTLMKLLIQRGCDINFKDFRGRTALNLSINDINVCAALVLLEAGCGVNIADQQGLTPLDWALTISHERFCLSQILVSYGARIDSLQSAGHSDKPSIGKLITSLEKIGQHSRKEPRLLELTQLLVSVCSPHSVENQRILLDNKGTPDGPERELRELNFHDIVNNELTLTACCRSSIRKSLGDKVLHKIDILPLPNQLKQYLHLDMDLADLHPILLNDLYVAIGERKLDQIKQLLISGINVDASFCGRVPMTLAAELGHDKVMEILLSHGANPDTVDDTGDSALLLAVKNRHVKVVRALLQTSADLENRELGQRSAILEAAFNGDEQIFELLLRAGADSRHTQTNRISCLHMIAGNGNVKMVRLLLENDFDPNSLDSNGSSALHVAASMGQLYSDHLRFPALYRENFVPDHIGVAKLLIDNGCNLTRTVVREAQISQPPNLEMISFLTQIISS